MATSFEQFRSASPRAVLWGAFPTRGGSAIRFSAGRAARRRPLVSLNTMDEVDVRKWPVAARLTLMVGSSLILWLAIAALLRLFA